jgi:hypothetical protein
MTDLISAEVGPLKLNIQLPTRTVSAYPARDTYPVVLSVPTDGRTVTVHFFLTLEEMGNLSTLLEIAHRELHDAEHALHFHDEPKV